MTASWPRPAEHGPWQDGDIVLAPVATRRAVGDPLRPIIRAGWMTWELAIMPSAPDGRPDHWIPSGSRLEDDTWVHDVPWPAILLVRDDHAMGPLAYLPQPPQKAQDQP